MASIVFTKLNDQHFETSSADGYGDFLEGYGIDAPDWMPSGGCKAVNGPEHHCVLRADPKGFREILARHLSRQMAEEVDEVEEVDEQTTEAPTGS
jgi:hypothetical protein